MELKNNQIIITISEDKKILTVECGAIHRPIDFSICPKNTIKSIGSAVEAYSEKTGLVGCIKEWIPEGCQYEGSGSCNDCN